MNKKFLSTALIISLLGIGTIGFNNSVSAVRLEDDVTAIRNQIFRLNLDYRRSCLEGLARQSVEPVENWRTGMLNLFNRLSNEDRARIFVEIARFRGFNINWSDVVNFSEIVRIPCPLNLEYSVELINHFLTQGVQRPNYPSDGNSILVMKVSLHDDLEVVIVI